MREAADEGLEAAGAVANGGLSGGIERIAAVVGEENVDVLEGGTGEFWGRRVVEPNP